MLGAGGGYYTKLIINGSLSIKVRILENILYVLRYLYTFLHSLRQPTNRINKTQIMKYNS